MSSPRILSVLTLNLWNRSGPWDERLKVIRAGLASLRPDIVALQEVTRMEDYGIDQAREVAGDDGYHVAWGQMPGTYLFGNAILSRFPIETSEALPLPREGTDENRCLVLARIRTPWGSLPVACTHLNWKLHEGHIRVVQVRHVVERLTAFAQGAELPAVLAGDFNAESDSDEIRYLRGRTGLGGPCVYFNDCFASAGHGDGHTFARRNPWAAECREPDRRIDYVFVRGPDEFLRGVPVEAEVCFDAPTEGVWASDHFGVFTRIAV